MKMKFSLKSGIWVGLVAALVAALVVVTGCNNSTDTASGNGGINLTREEAHTLPSGAQIHVVYDETGTVGVPVRLKVRLRAPGSAAGATKGTVHWGDNSDDRITDDHNVVVRHVYPAAGTYRFAIQIDGDEKMVAGTISVQPASALTGGDVVSSGSTASPVGAFEGYTCTPGESTLLPLNTIAFLELPGAFPPQFPTSIPSVHTSVTCNSGGSFNQVNTPSQRFNTFARGPGPCISGSSVELTVISDDGLSTAKCAWTVQ